MAQPNRKFQTGPWSKEETKLLKRSYRGHSTAVMAVWINRPLGAIKKKASRLGLRKTKKYMQIAGLAR